MDPYLWNDAVARARFAIAAKPELASLPLETVIFMSDAELMDGTDYLARLKAHDEAIAEYNMLRNTDPVEEYMPCPTCKVGRIDIKAKQTRSMDEGMTAFFRCVNPACGKKWVV
jgi:hypothetical protein